MSPMKSLSPWGTPPGDLLSAIRLVAGGEALLAPSVTRRLIGSSPSSRDFGNDRPAP
jgi:DNA-binding NarL/FixJ family response regulator